MSGSRPRAARGQALLPLVVLLAPMAALTLAALETARLVADQTRLQTAVDTAAYSAAALQAETLNEIAVANRLLAAHHATTAQVTSLVSHYRAIERAMHAASAAGVAVPALATPLALAGRAAGGAVAATTAVARTTVPLARGADALRASSVRARVLRADAVVPRRVDRVLRAAAPSARVAPTTAIALRSAPLARAITPGRPDDVIRVAAASVEPFTAGRAGRPPRARTFRLARVGKSGATQLGHHVTAVDRVGLDLGSHGHLGIEARARGREFGQGAVPGGWGLRQGTPAPVRVRATMVSGGVTLQARAAAAAVYRRPGRPGEMPSLYGPFWRPRLVPWSPPPALSPEPAR
jgi:hypothetical protein